jgi:hypothetical protein
MTMAAAFDTLKYAEALKAGGIPEPQAKAQVAALADAFKDSAGDLATKTDLLQLENRLGERMARLESTLGERTTKVEDRMTRLEGRQTLVQWMLAFNLAVSLGTLGLLIRIALDQSATP